MKILMVCLGNICRSPLMEGVLKHKLTAMNLSAEVDSAGTGSWHIGKLPDLRSIHVAKQHGIDITDQRARQIEASDLNHYDKIYVADREVYDSVLELSKDLSIHRKKVDFLMNVIEPDSDRPVPDPYFGGPDGFEQVYDMINEACEHIVAALKKAN